MKELWKLSLRSILALGFAVMLLTAAGCGDDDDDDDVIAIDTTPAAFTITPQFDVALSAVSTSAPITVTGINSPAPISVTGTGATYAINGGTFTSTAGTVTNGQTVTVRHTNSGINNTATTSTLNIGGVTAPFHTFTVAAAGQDTTPTSFTFTPLTGTGLNRSLTSTPITVAGITAPAPIVVQGGTYSINGGAFTSNIGTVSNTQTVVVRQTSSATNNTPSTATLFIGGVSAPFTTTTAPVGGAITTPSAFTFTNMSSVALNSTVTSAPITVSGITGTAPISVSGGSYSINGGTFVTTAGTVTNGQTVAVRHTASAANSTVTTTTLNIGGVTAPFTSTTITAAGGVDTTPTPFTFTNQTGVALGSVVTAAPITVAGINAPAPISITGGTYSIDSGPFVSTAGTVTNGQTVAVRHTASATNNTVTTTTLDIGGVTAPFTSTTIAAGTDTTPTAFTFAPQTGVALGAVTTSGTITVAGINAAAPISVTGGSYSINGGTFVTTAGNVTNGQTVAVRHNASATNNTVTTTTLNIGGVTAPFTSTTVAASGPDAFTLFQTKAVPGDPTQTCASCHSLGALDTTGSPNLAGTVQMPIRYPIPGSPGHFGIVLTAPEIAALTTLFQSTP